jgi:hypothetical protein
MSIIGRDQYFGLDCSFVDSAKSEVNDLIGMAEGKTATASGVTGVGGRAGITLANVVRHSCGVDATDQTSSTFHEEFAVPNGGRRQPDFGLNFRIGRRSESDGNLTVSCGLCCGGDVTQDRHINTRCLGEERDREYDDEQEEQSHARILLRPGGASLAGSAPRNTVLGIDHY